MKRRIGFSLIELLAVIGIIVTLVSLAFVATQTIRHNADAAACMSNQRQIWLMLTACLLTATAGVLGAVDLGRGSKTQAEEVRE